ncbi:lysozyme [Aquidulcibacter sp.]|uniref:lysozyme n=1 Tax=Aquidulcibacter sp. TaxID=2052990 RepID=UPI0028A8B846|nr:lysozyme [Aquidulcibacter sp.]
MTDIKQIGKPGLDLIKSFEGLKLRAYLCPAKVWTIGFGSTGQHVTPGKVITEAQAEELLKDDLDRFEAAVTRLVTVPLHQNQYDALVSFAFNVGISALERSTLLKRVNAKLFDQAKAEFAKWNRAGGRPLAGLTRRRAAEAALFGS